MELDKQNSSIVILLILAMMMTWFGVLLSQINKTLHAQLEYEAEYDLCIQDAWQYNELCRVERDEDGSYHWYFKPTSEEV